jgi:tRNA A-37 threonylcarbamoyl transferase component Bud32/class 3 adenylate cyclase
MAPIAIKERSALLISISFVRHLVSILLWAVILGFLALFALQFWHPPKIESLWLVARLRLWSEPLVTQVNTWLELSLSAARYIPLGLAVATWVIKDGLNRSLRGIHGRLAQPVQAAHGAASPAKPTGLRDETADIDLGALPPDSEKAREELLGRYQKIEQALKSVKRKACTFLSVDIVGSTTMKVGVDETDIAVSFHAYEDMLKKIFKQYDAWKQAWTPDGVMVCFLQEELAVGAAQRILQSLDNFNENHNRIGTPFRVRCGINEGEVPIYEDTNLERLADRVIDVAGHMQKEANRNSLWLSHELYSLLADKSGFHPIEKKVDGYEVYEWSLEHAVAHEATRVGEGEVVPAAPPATAPPVETGAVQRIRRYEILDELGRGAMGAVYKARDPKIGRTVAVKVILTTGLPPEAVEEYKQRFNREAKTAGQMTHPGIVTIHDISEDEGGQPFLVMEFMEGTTLEKLKPPLPNALDIAIQVAEAIDYAHRRGIIHRDLKPANIILGPDGRAKILDFGIAQMSGSQLTRVGQILGTPAFMSPEQFSGAKVGARSDIFSLGAVIYWMLTGEIPFKGQALTDIALQVIQGTPTAARELNPALPLDSDVVLSRCLAKDSTERYLTGQALAADLRALQAGRSVAANSQPTASLSD